MIWATVAEVRTLWTAHRAAFGTTEWPALPDSDAAVQTMLDSAARSLTCKVIRWPIVDPDTDRPVDANQQALLVVAVCETIRARLQAITQEAALGGLSPILAAGGSISADNLAVSGGRGAYVGRSSDPVPWAAYEALQDAGLIGGSVATW